MSIERRIRLGFLCCTALFLCATPTLGDPKPLSKEEQAKVDKAIERAVAYIKKSQKETGDFGEAGRDQIGMYANHGYIFFPALALLESGVAVDDPAIQKVVRLVRELEPKLDRTYEVSLAILFLDRLGDPKDEERIRNLSLRLLAAQTYTGGWGYACPTVSNENQRDLLKLLEQLQSKYYSPRAIQEGATAKDRNPRNARVTIPPQLRLLAIAQNPKNTIKRVERGLSWANPPEDLNVRYLISSTDNSNTQFALLALCASGRHSIPISPTADLIVRRFASSQNKDGSWCYRYRPGGFTSPEKGNIVSGANCNTAAGLIGLAMFRWANISTNEETASAHDDRILNAITRLSRDIVSPTGRMDKEIRREDLYFLWSVERVATLYNLSSIAGKDWYRWGSEILVANQNEEGSWDHKGFPRWGDASTQAAFGLLFLKRANWTKVLTEKLSSKGRELEKSIVARVRALETQSLSQGGESLDPKNGSQKSTRDR